MSREAERKRLVELLKHECDVDGRYDGEGNCPGCKYNGMEDCSLQELADHLLDNGIVVPKCNPIGVMTDGNEFNSDVYCPYCGNNLSGLYGDEPTPIIQCYGCGEFLDNTKTITREEAEKALRKEDDGK